MRKSFILSLVMVVVLIASLATATFAWYTSQTQVTVTTTTVTTASAGDSIVIDKTYINDVNATKNSVTLTMDSAASYIYDPAVLKSDADDYLAYTYDDFKVLTATVDKDGKFNSADSTGHTPATIAEVDSITGSYIYVANVGGTAGGERNFTVTVTLGTQVDKCLRVAVFQANDVAAAQTASDKASFALLGIWTAGGTSLNIAEAIAIGNTTSIESGIVAGTANSKIYASGTAVAAGTLKNQVAKNDVFAIYVWFEGDRLTNSGVAQDITFDIAFNLA